MLWCYDCYFISGMSNHTVINVDCILGGELGGPVPLKIASSSYLFLLWIMYVTLSSLEAYGYIEGF